jgi:hypothetical protein
VYDLTRFRAEFLADEEIIRIFSEYFDFPLSLSFHQCFMRILASVVDYSVLLRAVDGVFKTTQLNILRLVCGFEYRLLH